METKKYIIEIPDNTAWLQWVKVSDKDGHVCFDFKDPEDLTPYTEPDLDAVKKEVHDKCMSEAEDLAYKLYSPKIDESYQRGLNDAWEAASKIVHLQWDGAWAGVDEVEKWFDTYTASEAIEKIRQHEEIKVWDEVQHKSCNSIKIIVLNKESDVITGIAIEDVPFACKVGEMYINRDVKDWEKTGKHYEIAEVLKKMQGEKNG